MKGTGDTNKKALFNLDENESTRYSKAAYVTKVSMVVNVLLTGFKFLAGIVGNSSANGC